MIKPLEYYFAKEGVIEHVIFNKYTINEYGVVRNKKTGKMITTYKIEDYNAIGVYADDGKRRGVMVGRAIASTFLGPPPTPEHTADHIDVTPKNDTLENIRWLCKSGQSKNRDIPGKYNTTFLIVKNGEEKTSKEWAEHLKDEKNHLGHEYTDGMIKKYAQKKQLGFSYKEYPDLDNEVWKDIVGTKEKWKISDMNRVKQITSHAENVLSGDRIGLVKGYPKVSISGKTWPCHILSFMTFFPEEYANKKKNEMILHEDDDKLDFRPHKLRLGTHSANAADAHKNGKYENMKSVKMKCVSYLQGIIEKEHESQHDAAKYLKSKGHPKASEGNICIALSGIYRTAYDRTWEKI